MPPLLDAVVKLLPEISEAIVVTAAEVQGTELVTPLSFFEGVVGCWETPLFVAFVAGSLTVAMLVTTVVLVNELTLCVVFLVTGRQTILCPGRAGDPE